MCCPSFPTPEKKEVVHVLISLLHHFLTLGTNKENFIARSVKLDYDFLTSLVLRKV